MIADAEPLVSWALVLLVALILSAVLYAARPR